MSAAQREVCHQNMTSETLYLWAAQNWTPAPNTLYSPGPSPRLSSHPLAAGKQPPRHGPQDRLWEGNMLFIWAWLYWWPVLNTILMEPLHCLSQSFITYRRHNMDHMFITPVWICYKHCFDWGINGQHFPIILFFRFLLSNCHWSRAAVKHLRQLYLFTSKRCLTVMIKWIFHACVHNGNA